MESFQIKVSRRYPWWCWQYSYGPWKEGKLTRTVFRVYILSSFRFCIWVLPVEPQYRTFLISLVQKVWYMLLSSPTDLDVIFSICARSEQILFLLLKMPVIHGNTECWSVWLIVFSLMLLNQIKPELSLSTPIISSKLEVTLSSLSRPLVSTQLPSQKPYSPVRWVKMTSLLYILMMNLGEKDEGWTNEAPGTVDFGTIWTWSRCCCWCLQTTKEGKVKKIWKDEARCRSSRHNSSFFSARNLPWLWLLFEWQMAPLDVTFFGCAVLFSGQWRTKYKWFSLFDCFDPTCPPDD